MKIITGMHRSGTSMITNLLLAIEQTLDGQDGVDDEFIEADEWNRKGYYENKDFVILNNTILLGEYAPSSSYLNIPPDKRNAFVRGIMSFSNLYYFVLMAFPKIIERRSKRWAPDIQALGALHKEKIVKDPRFCLLMDEWQAHADVSSVLFCYRNPREVAQSLSRRNHIPLFAGFLLWQFHVGKFLKSAKDANVSYVKYSNFFDLDLRMDEIAKLYKFLGKPFERNEAIALMDEIVDISLRNNIEVDERYPRKVGRLLVELDALSKKK